MFTAASIYRLTFLRKFPFIYMYIVLKTVPLWMSSDFIYCHLRFVLDNCPVITKVVLFHPVICYWLSYCNICLNQPPRLEGAHKRFGNYLNFTMWEKGLRMQVISDPRFPTGKVSPGSDNSWDWHWMPLIIGLVVVLTSVFSSI